MAADRPNLLLIFTDMQRWDTVRALGNPVIKTPALDRLAREGTAFASCYTPSPVCVSARYAMHYGKWSSRTGVTENQSIPADADDSAPAHLGRAGYRTHGIGKMHFDGLRGFAARETQEEIVGRVDEDDYLQYLIAKGHGHIRDPHGVRGEMYYVPQVAQMPAEHHPTQWVGDRSLAFIEEGAKRREPWMLMSSYIHPHPPFAVPNPWHKLYRGFDMPLPAVPHDAAAMLTWINRMQNRYKYRDQGIDQHLVRLMKAYYYACISFVDLQVGRLLAALERTGQLDRTLIVFTSDHGEFLGDFDCFGKRSMHDASARVPMLARLPGAFPAGAVVDRPASLVDVPATMLAVAGIDARAQGMDGEDLAAVAAGRSKREAVFGQCGSNGTAQYLTVTKEWKYFYSAPDDREFLIDRRVDPLETRNRAGLPTTRGPLEGMRRRLLGFLAEQKAESAYERDAGGTLRWRKHPKLEIPADPDTGLLVQDHPWAINDIEGYTAIAPSLKQWQVLGAFPATAQLGARLSQDTPFEADFRKRGDGTIDLATTWAAGAAAATGGGSAKSAKAAWKAVTARRNGYVDLIEAFGSLEHVIAYGYTEVDWPESREAVIGMGSDDGIRLWVNGVEAFAREAMRGFTNDEDEVRVRLKPGRNRLLVKVDQVGGGWGFGVSVR
jgi:arylsulfatase A-like enzyme